MREALPSGSEYLRRPNEFLCTARRESFDPSQAEGIRRRNALDPL